MKRVIFLMISVIALFSMAACSAPYAAPSAATTSGATTVEPPTPSAEPSAAPTAEMTAQQPTKSAAQHNATSQTIDVNKLIPDKQKFFADAVDYLVKGDEEIAGWSKRFLDCMDLDAAFDEYIAEYEDMSGDAVEIADEVDTDKIKDPANFAKYVDTRALMQHIVPENWKKLFEADFKEANDEKIVKYEDIGDYSYQVYVKIDGKEAPFVTVNSITGYYHG